VRGPFFFGTTDAQHRPSTQRTQFTGGIQSTMKHYNNPIRFGLVFLCSLLVGLVIVGCETDDDDDSSSSTSTAATSIDVTGSWLYSNTHDGQSTWALIQASNGSITGAGTSGETITGGISSASISLGLVYANSSTCTLTGSASTNVMSGSFSNSTAVSGTWAAVKTD
jgi:hypothetical protein